MNASAEFLKYWILVAAVAMEGFVFPTIKWPWEDNFKLILLNLTLQHNQAWCGDTAQGCVNGCPRANYTPLTMQRKCSFSTCPCCSPHFSLSDDPKFWMNPHIFRVILGKKNWLCVGSSKSMIHYFKCIPGEKRDVILKLNSLASFPKIILFSINCHALLKHKQNTSRNSTFFNILKTM